MKILKNYLHTCMKNISYRVKKQINNLIFKIGYTPVIPNNFFIINKDDVFVLRINKDIMIPNTRDKHSVLNYCKGNMAGYIGKAILQRFPLKEEDISEYDIECYRNNTTKINLSLTLNLLKR